MLVLLTASDFHLFQDGCGSDFPSLAPIVPYLHAGFQSISYCPLSTHFQSHVFPNSIRSRAKSLVDHEELEIQVLLFFFFLFSDLTTLYLYALTVLSPVQNHQLSYLVSLTYSAIQFQCFTPVSLREPFLTSNLKCKRRSLPIEFLPNQDRTLSLTLLRRVRIAFGAHEKSRWAGKEGHEVSLTSVIG